MICYLIQSMGRLRLLTKSATSSTFQTTMFGNLLNDVQKTMFMDFYGEFKDSLTPKQKVSIAAFWEKLKPTLSPLQKGVVDSILNAVSGK